jgi:Mrp family chromosome partitioning ATPase
MFERYRDIIADRNSDMPAHRGIMKYRHAQVQRTARSLPFDLELTRRIRGADFAPEWSDSALIEQLDPWQDLSRVSFAREAAPLDIQLGLLNNDRAMLRAFDDLRTQLLRAMDGSGWSRIAIVSPTSGSGASFTALNLALSVSRIPSKRALLMDLDQRAPDIANMLGIQANGMMADLLTGAVAPQNYLLKPTYTLALGLGSGRTENASEILHARRTGEVLNNMMEMMRPDISIFDLPAMLEHDDLEAFLPQVDGVLLVADATQTVGAQITECERRLEGKTNIMGIILNRTRPAQGS